ncbi:SulP family inorganic anion transporter, partial [Anaerosporobacter sp.]|uniref:SulP family inorganic anion transporter n=1 Tax=Anaerosporobacter sp. TaxID=1872529 RepID=UPI00286F44F3
MDKYKPKLLSVMKHYDKRQFTKDATAGIIVAIIALPLSIAFALGCGVSAEKGIYSAIISSIIVALLGGSRVQITGPTGAFIIIIQSIINHYGLDGLMIATILAGIMLILMGIFRLGKLIKFIPAPITIGFTGGIAVTIFTLEMKDFLGLSFDKMPTNFFGKWNAYLTHLSDVNYQSILLGLLCILILVLWPKVHTIIPNSLIAIIVGTCIAYFANLDVKTLGEIPKSLSFPTLPDLSLDDIFDLMQPAFTIAVLVAMQALLSAVVTDGLTYSKHRSNMELIAQGVANIVLGLFGCIPATGGVARSISNAKNGAKTPIAAIFHGLTLFLFLMIGMPLIKHVPLCVLAAILIVVSYNMFNVKAFLSYAKAPKSDIAVLISSCILTFAFDLVLAIEIGMVLACGLFMKRMADVTNVNSWKYIGDSDDIDEDNNPDSIHLKKVPSHTLVFELNGPLFFGAADKLLYIQNELRKDTKVVILRMHGVPAVDVTALNTLRKIQSSFEKKGITLVLSHVL